MSGTTFRDTAEDAAPASPAASTLREYMSNVAGAVGLHLLDSSGDDRVVCRSDIATYRVIKEVYINQGTTSYTPSSGALALWVEGWGAGGGGAGVAQATSSQETIAVGGGEGAYSCAFLTGAAVTASYTCQVGNGGSGGIGAANGGAGTDTTLTDSNSVLRLTAKGGALGATASGLATGTSGAVTGAGGAGGASGSGTGDALFDGGQGEPGFRLSGTAGVSGSGGGARGGPGVTTSSNGNGGGFPAGGGGGALDTGSSARNGGRGGNGLLRILELA